MQPSKPHVYTMNNLRVIILSIFSLLTLQDLLLNKSEENSATFRCLGALDFDLSPVQFCNLHILSTPYVNIVTVYLQCILTFTVDKFQYSLRMVIKNSQNSLHHL